MQKLFLIIIMLILCREDIQDQWLDCRWVFLLALCGICPIMAQGIMIWTYLLSVIPGMLFMAVSHVTGEALGEGDALALWSLGFSLSPEYMFRLCLNSFLLAGAAGMLYCLLSASRPHALAKRIPFLPFLTASLIWMLL